MRNGIKGGEVKKAGLGLFGIKNTESNFAARGHDNTFPIRLGRHEAQFCVIGGMFAACLE